MAAMAACVSLTGCMVGPDFQTPPAPIAAKWLETPTTRPGVEIPAPSQWWKAFNDPVLNKIVEKAYAQNLPLQVVGLRVLEARAARGIAVGEIIPQVQQINGSFSRVGASRENATPSSPRFFDATSASFDVAWELDLWGRFRRGIAAADASLYASVMSYNDALVTLVADVATAYINLRALDERIRVTQKNVQVQQSSLDIANVRFKAGGTTELDVQQARSQLSDTQARLPVLVQSRRQAENQLCVLLGLPPSDLRDLLGDENQVMPAPPEDMAVGIPAELLRRRPDIRRAEADAAAQCAVIGVARTDLLPHFQLLGSIGYTAENPGDMFRSSSLAYQAGPAFRWDVLNYGRIIDNVRVQDARFEELITQYQNTVLTAQQDVANAITALVHSREQSRYLSESVAAALRSVELSMTQYKAGGADFIRVLNATQFLVQEQDSLIVSQANVAASAIALNKALGGGWEIRGNNEFVPAETIQRMRNRTNWGNIIDPDYEAGKDMHLFPRPKTDQPLRGGSSPEQKN
jgi:NodT family efflux transporter outer membrane factor (OMF) lipoprotein